MHGDRTIMQFLCLCVKCRFLCRFFTGIAFAATVNMYYLLLLNLIHVIFACTASFYKAEKTQLLKIDLVIDISS